MTDCEYCSETFEDEAGYLRHLDDAHPDEMGPIERRKLDEIGGGGGDGLPTPLLVGALAVGALLLAIVLYTLTFNGGGDNLGPAPDPPHELGPAGTDQVQQPSNVGSVHSHGPISMTVDGQEIDFSQPEFQHPREIYAFHFESGQSRWHGHANGVTLEYALEATAFGVTDDSLSYDGVVYREGSDTSAPDGWEVVTDATVVYRVNGEPVDPETYVLKNGDSIVVQVQPPESANDEANATTTNGTTTASVDA